MISRTYIWAFQLNKLILIYFQFSISIWFEDLFILDDISNSNPRHVSRCILNLSFNWMKTKKLLIDIIDFSWYKKSSFLYILFIENLLGESVNLLTLQKEMWTRNEYSVHSGTELFPEGTQVRWLCQWSDVCPIKYWW